MPLLSAWAKTLKETERLQDSNELISMISVGGEPTDVSLDIFLIIFIIMKFILTMQKIVYKVGKTEGTK